MKYFFIYTILSIFIGMGILLFATLWWPLSAHAWQAVLIGFSLAAIYVIAGFLSFYRGITSGQKTFNLILFGSIFVRLVLAASTLIVLFMFTEIDKQAFLISMLVWYMVLQIGEIISFHKLTARKA